MIAPEQTLQSDEAPELTPRKQAAPLPVLRQDLRLMPGAATKFGEPTWLIYDPVRHRYFAITKRVHDLLRVWASGGPGAVKHTVSTSDDPTDTKRALDQLVYFLHPNSLTETSAENDYRSYVAQQRAAKRTWLQHLVHSYLFVRIPVFRPQKFLERTYPLVAPLASRAALYLYVSLTLTGLYFVSRQWDTFAATFLYFFSWDGLLVYGLSLIVVKTLHELGHAYMAVGYGARVNTMGVALMVMMPVLYTDVSDSWRLQSRRKKLMIDGAGIFVELAIAGVATFLWVFLPDGALKSAAFLLATTSWILSLAINLNPFMRFDGYYLLADWWDIPNLQPRSFAFGRWKLREVLFGLGLPAPEPMPRNTRRALILYAYGTWIYRLVLFIGIALLVYYLFFKALGVLLFAIEIAMFILVPVAKEIGAWWSMRRQILATRRTAWTGASVAALLIAALVPWSTTVRLPAVFVAATETHVYAPMPAEILAVHAVAGARVAAGDSLFDLYSPGLEHELAQAERRIQLLQARRARLAGDPSELRNLMVIEQQLAAGLEQANGLKRERARLAIVAPTAGVVRDINPDLHAGRWIDAHTELALVLGSGEGEAHVGAKAKALVGEDDVWRLSANTAGRFIADDPILAATAVQLDDISYAAADTIDIPYLASIYGGAIAVEKEKSGRLRPVRGTYLVTFSTDRPANAQATRGVIHVSGKSESFASAMWRQVMRVLVRESGV